MRMSRHHMVLRAPDPLPQCSCGAAWDMVDDLCPVGWTLRRVLRWWLRPRNFVGMGLLIWAATGLIVAVIR